MIVASETKEHDHVPGRHQATGKSAVERLGKLVKFLFARAVLGAICGFFVMLVVAWTAMFFEAVPPEPTATNYATILFFGVAILVAVLGRRAAKAAALTVPIFMFCAGLVMIYSAVVAVAEQPDLNGDGVFTIRDLLAAIVMVLTAPGGWYSTMIFGDIDAANPIVVFLEAPVWLIAWPIRIGLTAFYWFLTFGWPVMIVKWDPLQEAAD